MTEAPGSRFTDPESFAGRAGQTVGGHDIGGMDRLGLITVEASSTEYHAVAILIQSLDVPLELNEHRRMRHGRREQDLLVGRLGAKARRLRARLDHRATNIDFVVEHEAP